MSAFYAQVVAEELSVRPEMVTLIMGDTDRTPAGLTGGSRSLPVGGSALYEASDDVIEKGRALAAHLLEASAADVQFADATFFVPGTDLKLDLFAVAEAARDAKKLPKGMTPGLDATKHRVPLHMVDPDQPDTIGYNPCTGEPFEVSNKLLGAFSYGDTAEVYRLACASSIPVVVRAIQATGRPVTL